MLRVRCLRGGSRGAEALHYIGSRVRAPSPRRPAACSPPLLPSLSPRQLCPTVSFLGPVGSLASRASAACRELGGVPGEGGAALPSRMGVG